MTTEQKAIPVKEFGKDHWSLMGYVGCRITENPAGPKTPGVGVLSQRHLRCKDRGDWRGEYGTRLAGFFLGDGKCDEVLRLVDHDDYDCLEDLEAAGFVEIVSNANKFVRFTKLGLTVHGELCKHKAEGKPFAYFKWPLQKDDGE